MTPVQFQQKIKIKLPLFESFVHAGFPSPAEDYSDKKLDLNEFLIKHPSSTFFVKVEGDSMIGAGIFPGDMLVVDRYPVPQSGQVVLAILDGEFTIKRYLKKGKRVFLLPENLKYRAIELEEGQELIVWGVVIQVLHDPNG
jgi:DNA polymerase V